MDTGSEAVGGSATAGARAPVRGGRRRWAPGAGSFMPVASLASIISLSRAKAAREACQQGIRGPGSARCSRIARCDTRLRWLQRRGLRCRRHASSAPKASFRPSSTRARHGVRPRDQCQGRSGRAHGHLLVRVRGRPWGPLWTAADASRGLGRRPAGVQSPRAAARGPRPPPSAALHHNSPPECARRYIGTGTATNFGSLQTPGYVRIQFTKPSSETKVDERCRRRRRRSTTTGSPACPARRSGYTLAASPRSATLGAGARLDVLILDNLNTVPRRVWWAHV